MEPWWRVWSDVLAIFSPYLILILVFLGVAVSLGEC